MISLTSNDNQHVNESMEHFMQESNCGRRAYYHRHNLYSNSIIETGDVLYSRKLENPLKVFCLHCSVAQNKFNVKDTSFFKHRGLPFVALIPFRLIALIRLSLTYTHMSLKCGIVTFLHFKCSACGRVDWRFHFGEKCFILFISSLCFNHFEKHVQKQLCNCNFKLNLVILMLLVPSCSDQFMLFLMPINAWEFPLSFTEAKPKSDGKCVKHC